MIQYPGRPRERKEDTRHNLPAHWTNYVGTNVAATGVAVGSDRYTRDWVTKDYRKLSADGRIVMSPYLHGERTVMSECYAGLQYYTGGNPAVWGKYYDNWAHNNLQWGLDGPTFGRFNIYTEEEVQRLRVLASTRVLSQKGRPSADQWENLAELGKTLELLKAPFYSWFRYYRKLGDKGSALLSAANLWLTMRYGLIPLIKSTIETVEQLKKRHRPERRTTRAREVISTSRASQVYWVWGNTWGVTYGIQETESHEVRAMSIDEALFGMTGFDGGLLFDAGFSAKSLWALPWELIPHSFVADWFFNAGDFIGALGSYFQDASLGSCIVHKTVYSHSRTELSIVDLPGNNQTITQQSKHFVRADVVWKDRTLGLTSPGITHKSDYRLDSATRIGDLYSLVGKQILSAFGKSR